MNSAIVLSVLFANLVWGLSPLLAKAGLQNLSDVTFLLTRFGLSTLLFLPLIVKSVGKFSKLPRGGFVLGIVTVAVHYYLQVVALRQVPVTWYVFFYALCPILNLFVVGGSVTGRNLLVGFLAIAGTTLFLDFDSAPQISFGTVCVLLGSVLSWVLFTWTLKHWQNVLSDGEVSATTSFLSFVIFLLWALFTREPVLNNWDVKSGLMTLFLAVLLPLAFLAYSFSLRKSPSVAVLGQYSEPVFGTIGSMIFLGEQLSFRQYIGFVFVGLTLWVLLTKVSSVSKMPSPSHTEAA